MKPSEVVRDRGFRKGGVGPGVDVWTAIAIAYPANAPAADERALTYRDGVRYDLLNYLWQDPHYKTFLQTATHSDGELYVIGGLKRWNDKCCQNIGEAIAALEAVGQ